MAKINLVTMVLIPLGVGVGSGALESLKANAEVVLEEDIAANKVPADSTLNPIIKWLPTGADLVVGVAGPVLYGMDILKEAQGGRELSAAGLAIGGRRLTTLIAQTILGIETKGSRKPKTPKSGGYTLTEVERGVDGPAAFYGSPTNVWESYAQ